MIVAKENQLCIIIKDNNPQSCKDRILKALAAAIRWRASYSEDYRDDDMNLLVLSQLQEEMTNNEQ